MPGFFEFLSERGYESHEIKRLDIRWDHIIKPFLPEIEGARVLDLASHDGRWPYAFAAAGAREVIAVEGRAETVAQFADFPDTDARRRVNLSAGNLFDFCRDLVARGEKFDVIGILGVFYHIMDHNLLLTYCRELGAKLVIIDSLFMDVPESMILVKTEPVKRDLNAIAAFEGQKRGIQGIVSIPAFREMAELLEFSVEQVSWEDVDAEFRQPRLVKDYFRAKKKRRYTFALRRQAGSSAASPNSGAQS